MMPFGSVAVGGVSVAAVMMCGGCIVSSRTGLGF